MTMADPQAILQQQLKKNFPKFGNIRQPVIYQVMATALYDPGVGIPIDNVEAEYPLMVIFDVATLGAQGNVQVDEDTTNVRELRVALFPALDLPVTPKNGDRIIKEDSSEWGVVGVIPDPAGAHYELVIRPWQA